MPNLSSRRVRDPGIFNRPEMQTAQPDLRAVEGVGPVKLEVEALSFFYGKTQALHDVSFEVREKRVTAIIGPSGCGKSTLLRVFNRMYDLVPGAQATGAVMCDGENIVTTRRLLELRQKIGMVFQRPSAFPMSIRDNVAFAPRLLGWSGPRVKDSVATSLERAALWDEVKDRLDDRFVTLRRAYGSVKEGGSAIVNTWPPSGAVSVQILPPRVWTRCFEIARPRPKPPASRGRARSTL